MVLDVVRKHLQTRAANRERTKRKASWYRPQAPHQRPAVPQGPRRQDQQV